MSASNQRNRELSPEATALLDAAVAAADGSLLRIKTLDGLIVQANGTNFVKQVDLRSEATWHSAVSDLEAASAIRDTGYKGELFAVTDEGVRFARSSGDCG
jgi:hypothetical protein